jgi:3',5'-cyclic-nucleotide phosphodiesterase
MTPFITLAIANSYVYTKVGAEFQKTKSETEGFAALLEVAELLSGQLDIVRLTEIIMEKGRQLTHSDRCSLFLVNDKRDRLITSIQKGLDNAINIPIDKGIAGQTVQSGKVLMIKDAYDSAVFDSSVDSETGYRTRSILSVPIFNPRGEVIGVTEMVNKSQGSEEFTKWDCRMIQIFNVFCGISIENVKLYQESRDMSSQLRSFFDVSFSLSQSENIHRILNDIIHNARRVIGAARASLFLVDEAEGVMTSFLTDGGVLPPTLPLTSGIVGSCATNKQSAIVNDVYADPRFNRTIDQTSGFVTKSLCVAPIVSSSGALLGVVEMVNKAESEGGFVNKDLKLLESFAAFASVSLENSRLRDMAGVAGVDSEIPKFMSESEKRSYAIPGKLRLPVNKQQEASSLAFFAIDWKGTAEIQLIFFLFSKFHILEKFKITSEMLFRYLTELKGRYNDVPYHNWIHAGDVTEYLAYELSTAKMTEVLSPLEIFTMLVAATGHDTHHQGYTNIYNVKAETPLGILFKDQSVMETHHCTELISILTKEEFNLMHALSAHDSKKMWTLMIRLILATDMAHHFRLVKTLNELVDGETLDMSNDEHRLLVMQMLLKVADISNVSRPFEIADKWCDVLCDEFFRQGDSEKSQGIELTSPLNDRNNSNKPKSQIGFYNFICIPLYAAVAKAYPPLQVNLASVKSNLEVWKEQAAAQAPPPA